jgi:hypothetical protein
MEIYDSVPVHEATHTSYPVRDCYSPLCGFPCFVVHFSSPHIASNGRVRPGHREGTFSGFLEKWKRLSDRRLHDESIYRGYHVG